MDYRRASLVESAFILKQRTLGHTRQRGYIEQLMSKKPTSNTQIAGNKKAYHEYFVEEHYEAGLALQGWEVKSLRAGRAHLKESYVLLRSGEAFLFGCHISPLTTASTHVIADPIRTRKLLLHKEQIGQLVGAVERKGYALIPLALYWKRNRVKLDIGLARGKKEYDKRATEKDRDWDRDKQRLMRER
ncbi:trans-translation protein, binds tmRNA and tRNA [Candidatus Contendobacter odensis Run_B_J11]|uniref:SsrA-binding protein n=2 Tax=Candidatus Contendibacter odensensis TaxID=1400860 RepID=A0A7U7G7L3_9GAMM|nr:trans-translation protein, binds tmRNA and tRNA [Candidatus Contendobacter odensis Run_B_J11]